MNFIQMIDTNIIYFFSDKVQNNFLNPIIIFLTKIGDGGLFWILISLIFLFKKNYRKVGIISIIALMINFLLGEVILKNLIQRPRPFVTHPDLKLLIHAPTSFSCPSGHTSASFAVAFVIAYYLKKLAAPALIIASLISLSRIYLLVHYPSDILAGILLGLVSCILSILIYNKILFKRIE